MKCVYFSTGEIIEARENTLKRAIKYRMTIARRRNEKLRYFFNVNDWLEDSEKEENI